MIERGGKGLGRAGYAGVEGIGIGREKYERGGRERRGGKGGFKWRKMESNRKGEGGDCCRKEGGGGAEMILLTGRINGMSVTS